jgi:ribosomal protein S18 acetylase RimI-like enzyme
MFSEAKLDSPVWFALSETHAGYCIDYGVSKFYDPLYCPFGGFKNDGHIPGSILAYSKLEPVFFVVGDRPTVPVSIRLKNQLVCEQMIIENGIQVDYDERFVLLTEGDAVQLFELVKLVQPGYFRSKTHRLGNYYGIFEKGKLVSVTGERMKMHGHTEVSAVVTHPAYSGKGFATKLVAHTVNRVLESNRLPFLHVARTNLRAISLYEKLGFRHRRQITFWNYETI